MNVFLIQHPRKSGTLEVVPLSEHDDALECLRVEIERLRAEVDFLHKRRGEIAIERDRYKAALAEYPEGRDVFLGGALAEIERLRDDRQCTCHPEDNPPVPCAKQYALTECREVERLRGEVSRLEQGDAALKRAVERLRAESAAFEQAWKDACARAEKMAEDLAAAKSAIENIVVSEVEPLQALLREVLDQCRETDKMLWDNQLYKRIHAALSDKPTPPNASDKP